MRSDSRGKLGALLPPGDEPTGEPTALLREAPAGWPDAGRIPDTLIAVCDFLSEMPGALSDVPVDVPNCYGHVTSAPTQPFTPSVSHAPR